MLDLSPEKAWIFRITHIENVPWILANGLHCRNSTCRDPNFKEIGNQELIAKRAPRPVPIPPGGTLSDYVPFYFTPCSPMLLNIKTGFRGLPKIPMSDIAILVTSLPHLAARQVPFVFSDRHAYLQTAQFFTDLQELNRLDWPSLKAMDFTRTGDLEKFEKYQAEALVHRHLPASSLLGIACNGPMQEESLRQVVDRLSTQLKVLSKPNWFFS